MEPLLGSTSTYGAPAFDWRTAVDTANAGDYVALDEGDEERCRWCPRRLRPSATTRARLDRAALARLAAARRARDRVRRRLRLYLLERDGVRGRAPRSCERTSRSSPRSPRSARCSRRGARGASKPGTTCHRRPRASCARCAPLRAASAGADARRRSSRSTATRPRVARLARTTTLIRRGGARGGGAGSRPRPRSRSRTIRRAACSPPRRTARRATARRRCPS